MCQRYLALDAFDLDVLRVDLVAHVQSHTFQISDDAADVSQVLLHLILAGVVSHPETRQEESRESSSITAKVYSKLYLNLQASLCTCRVFSQLHACLTTGSFTCQCVPQVSKHSHATQLLLLPPHPGCLQQRQTLINADLSLPSYVSAAHDHLLPLIDDSRWRRLIGHNTILTGAATPNCLVSPGLLKGLKSDRERTNVLQWSQPDNMIQKNHSIPTLVLQLSRSTGSASNLTAVWLQHGPFI